MEMTPEIQEMMMQFFMERMAEEKADKLRRYDRLNKLVRKGQILFCGSSLMEQFPINELLMDREEPLTIYNRGVGGFTTEEMAAALETCVFALEPKYIFINIGTNDLNLPEYTREGLLERYAGILQQIRDRLPDARLFLLAYYPVNDEIGLKNPFMADAFRQRTNQRINEANEGVKELAASFGAEFLNVNEGIMDEAGRMKAEYTIEGMHMYGDGYDKVLDKLLPLLKTLH